MIKELAAKIKGNCSWFDLFQTERKTTPIEFKNNKLYTIREQQNSGTGLRLNKNGKTGFSYTNNSEDMDDLLSKAQEVSAFGEKETLSLPAGEEDYPLLELLAGNEFDVDIEVEKGRLVIDEIRNEFPDADVDISISNSSGSRRIVNSSGLDIGDSSTAYFASVSVTRVDKSGSRFETYEHLSSPAPISIESLKDKLLLNMRYAQQTDTLESGKVPVYLTHKAFSSLLNILLGGLTAHSLYKHVSPYEGKFGTKLFHENFSMFDNPLVSDSVYSYTFDDEGIPASITPIFENGVVSNFISEIKYASLLHSKSSGNAERSYASLPSAAFSNLEIASGTRDSAELISSIQDGLIVDQFIGLGQSNTFTGDFSASLDLAFRVKNGSVTGRVKDAMISDNVFNLFGEGINFSSDRMLIGNCLLPGVLIESVNFSS